jgi:hypothetical protein
MINSNIGASPYYRDAPFERQESYEKRKKESRSYLAGISYENVFIYNTGNGILPCILDISNTTAVFL